MAWINKALADAGVEPTSNTVSVQSGVSGRALDPFMETDAAREDVNLMRLPNVNSNPQSISGASQAYRSDARNVEVRFRRKSIMVYGALLAIAFSLFAVIRRKS